MVVSNTHTKRQNHEYLPNSKRPRINPREVKDCNPANKAPEIAVKSALINKLPAPLPQSPVVAYADADGVTRGISQRKYPPPRENVHANRDFPANRGPQNNVSSLKNCVSANAKVVDACKSSDVAVVTDLKRRKEDGKDSRVMSGISRRKYLPPRKNFHATPNFPANCGLQNNVFSLKNIVSANEKVVDACKLSDVAALTDLKRSKEDGKDAGVMSGISLRKYPPPRKDFDASRKFPANCGLQNNVSSLKNSDSANGKIVDACKSSDVAAVVSDLKRSKDGKDAFLTDLKRSKEDGTDVNIDLIVSDRKCEMSAGENLVVLSQDYVSRYKVEETLNLFRELFAKLLGEQEKPKMRWGRASVYIGVAMLLQKQQKWLNTTRQVGAIPGVEVGDRFQCRAELVVIGLHSQFFCGIDYMKKDGQLLATSIVDSGRYANDKKSSDVFIYVGEGGNPTVQKNQLKDQELERGNLALKNSMEAKTPIRVIHGFKFKNRKISNRLYVYDGLYLVHKYWQERGDFGKLVFKFLLKRVEGQPKLNLEIFFQNCTRSQQFCWQMQKQMESKLATRKQEVCNGDLWADDISQGKEKLPIRINDEKPPLIKQKQEVCNEDLSADDISQGKEVLPIRAMKIINDEKPPLAKRKREACNENLCADDISLGKEKLPIRAVNTINDDKLPLAKTKREVCNEDHFADDISQGKEKLPICVVNTINDQKPPFFKYIPNNICQEFYGCRTRSCCDCTDDYSNPKNCSCAMRNGGEIPFSYDGRIVKAKARIFGCNPSCKCSSSCINRVSQHGIQFQLEVFRTRSKRWGVRSCSYIPSGSFVCEYIGEIKRPLNEQRDCRDEYVFHNDGGYTIDATQFENVGRFINRSFSPNLIVQNILYDHDERRKPHIMLFAMRDIPSLQELTYGYTYKIGRVCD